METSDKTQGTDGAAPASGRAAFNAKLEALRTSGAFGPTSFSEALESEGVDVQVRPKVPAEGVTEEPEPEAPAEAPQEPQDGAEAPEPTVDPDADQEATDALLEAITGAKAGDKRAAKMERRNDIERRLVAAGVPDAIANSIAHRTKLADAEKYLASQEGKSENRAAGLDEPPPQGIPAKSATPAGWATPEVLESLSEAMGEAPASAIVQEFRRMQAELDAVKGQAQMSVEATKAQHRAAAQAALDSAVGELSGRFPGLVRDGVVDVSVRQTAAALLHTPLIGGDLNKALEQAARLRFPEAAGGSRQATAPAQARDTAAPSPMPQPSAKPLTPRELFARQAQIAGRFANDPQRAAAEMRKLRQQG